MKKTSIKKDSKFCGAMTAIVTPFRNGKIDEPSMRELVSWQIASGIDGIVVLGSTGEGATIEETEKKTAIKLCVEESAGRVPVIAGAGSNSTEKAIKLARLAAECGADAMLQVTPYYNKPTQQGLFEHFMAISEAVPLPMILYNVPSRTAVNMLPETTLRLAAAESIIGIKESSGDISQARMIMDARPANFTLYCGEDAMNLEMYSAGANGCISVTANIVPEFVSKVWDLFSAGKANEAEALQSNLQKLNSALFMVTNPIPVKTALSMMKKCREEFRLPLTPMDDNKKRELESVLSEFKII